MPKNIFQDWQGIPAAFDTPTDGTNYSIAVANRVWDPINLVWVSETQPTGGGGGGSVTQGTTPWVTDGQTYSTRVDTSASPIIYIGEAVVGSSESSAAWRIQKIDASVISIKWAGGSAAFNQVWTNRGSLSYS